VNQNLIIGTRGSDLALWQANFVKEKLATIGIDSEIKTIKTQGDNVQDLSFDKMEGKGFFTKEIEDALLRKEIDLAVHSHKDLETILPDGLKIAAVSERENPSDLLIIRREAVDVSLMLSLKARATVGTSSARRKSQLLAFRSDLQLKDLRGNVPTRVKKLKDGEYDAILVAAAGVKRLGLDLSEFHAEKLDPREFITAPAQGVLALQIREVDDELTEFPQQINDSNSSQTSKVERKVLNLFEGGCQLPLGVYCEKKDGMFHIWASAAPSWEQFPKRIYLKSETTEGLAKKAAEKLKDKSGAPVFVTRNLKEQSFFKRALEQNGYPVHGKSLIDFKAIEFNEVPETDWIFFSSKNSVRFFFEQQPQTGNAKFGAVGSATAKALRKYGVVPEFTGNSINTVEIGRAFAEVAKNEKVLFPQSKNSLKTVQQQFASDENLFDLITYETIESGEGQIPDTGVIVFTSPSNVRSYLNKKSISSEQKVIAIGNTTGKELEKHSISDYHLPWTSSEIALVDAVLSL